MTQTSPERARTLKLQDRAFAFAASVLSECPSDPIPHIGARELWKQVARAAPSASHNLIEADEASSSRDFLAKMKIALREAKEARNCLRLLVRCRLAPRPERLVPLEDEANQLSKIFAKIVINVKKREAANEARRRPPRKG